MTKEEIVKIAKGLRTDFKCESDIMVDFCNSIIKELEQEPITENDLRVDCISRQAVIDMAGLSEWFDSSDSYNEFVIALSELPLVTPQEPQTFKWCTNCKEYDQEKHCCHRWSNVIRDTVEEMKQEYVEREVLDKIRAEIEQKLEQEEFARSVFRHEEKDCTKAEQCTGSIMAYRNVLKMFDKYKAESEGEDELHIRKM